MNVLGKLLFVIKGKPINLIYWRDIEVEHYKKSVEDIMQEEDFDNPFSWSSKSLVGHFHGSYGRELTVKPKSSFYRGNTLSNSIWAKGVLKPLEQNMSELKLDIYRTKFLQLGHWVMIIILGLVAAFWGYKFLMVSDYLSFLMFEAVMVFFYASFLLIAVMQVDGQIKYLEKHLLLRNMNNLN